MKFSFLAAGIVLVGVTAARPSAALELSMAPTAPAVVGQPRTFKIASMTGAVGTVNLRWNFGDDSDPVETVATELSHTYTKPAIFRASCRPAMTRRTPASTSSTWHTTRRRRRCRATPPASSSTLSGTKSGT